MSTFQSITRAARVLFALAPVFDLLKATSKKTITVPGYYRGGQFIPPHQKVVHYNPDVSFHAVATGQGSFSQKAAHKELSGMDWWNTLSVDDKALHVMSLATDKQDAASASAAVSGWKAAALAGQNPKAGHWAAFVAQPGDKQAKLYDQVKEKAGGLAHLKVPQAVPVADMANPIPAPAPAPAAAVDPDPVASKLLDDAKASAKLPPKFQAIMDEWDATGNVDALSSTAISNAGTSPAISQYAQKLADGLKAAKATAKPDPVGIPNFSTYSDGIAWAKGQAQQQGLAWVAYTTSQEYKTEIYPALLQLYATYKAGLDAESQATGVKLQALMAEAGLKNGDKVSWSQAGAFLSSTKLSGVVKLDGLGVPFVHLDQEVPVSKPGGKLGYAKKLRWQPYMKGAVPAGQMQAPASLPASAKPVTAAAPAPVASPAGGTDYGALLTAMASGPFYQKEAIAKLKGSGWHNLPIKEQYEQAHALYQTLQGAASAAAAVSMFKKTMLAGKVPTPAQYKAMQDASSDVQHKVSSACAAVIGDDKYEQLLMQASANAKGATPVKSPAGMPAQVKVSLDKLAADGEWEHIYEAFASDAAEVLPAVKVYANKLIDDANAAKAVAAFAPLAPLFSSKPLHTFTNAADGLEATVVPATGKLAGQFNVVLKDTDAGEYVPIVNTYPTEAAAVASAKAAAGIKDGPQEGDKKTENGKSYELINGHWHRVDSIGIAYSPKMLGSAAKAAGKVENPLADPDFVAIHGTDGSSSKVIQAAMDWHKGWDAASVAPAAPASPAVVSVKVRTNAANAALQKFQSNSDVFSFVMMFKQHGTPVAHGMSIDGLLDPPEIDAYEALSTEQKMDVAAAISYYGPHKLKLFMDWLSAQTDAKLAAKPAVDPFWKQPALGMVKDHLNDPAVLGYSNQDFAAAWLSNNPGKEAELKDALSAVSLYHVAVQMGLVVAAPTTKKIPVVSDVYTNTTEGHKKFWGVSSHGKVMKTTYGKLGTQGQSTEKVFPTAYQASAAVDKLIAEKQKGGYKYGYTGSHTYEVDAPAPAPIAGNQTFTPVKPAASPVAAAPAPEAGIIEMGGWKYKPAGPGGWAFQHADSKAWFPVVNSDVLAKLNAQAKPAPAAKLSPKLAKLAAINPQDVSDWLNAPTGKANGSASFWGLTTKTEQTKFHKWAAASKKYKTSMPHWHTLYQSAAIASLMGKPDQFLTKDGYFSIVAGVNPAAAAAAITDPAKIQAAILAESAGVKAPPAVVSVKAGASAPAAHQYTAGWAFNPEDQGMEGQPSLMQETPNGYIYYVVNNGEGGFQVGVMDPQGNPQDHDDVLTAEDAAAQMALHIDGNNAEITKPSVADIQMLHGGPKDGDTKPGADGTTLVFKDGRWHKQAPAAPAAPTIAMPDFSDEPSAKWKGAYTQSAAVLQEAFNTGGAAAVKKLITIHKVGKLAGGFTINAGHGTLKVTSGSVLPRHAKMHAYVAALLAAKSKGAKVAKVTLSGVTATPPGVTPPKVTKVTAQAVNPMKPGVTDMSAWTQTGKQAGSNPGGMFKDKMGQEWYCKFPASEDHVKNELLASKLYKAAGIDAPMLRIVMKDGKIGIASKKVDGLSNVGAGIKTAAGALEGFAVDAWLGNYDAVGTGHDNLLKTKEGKAIRIDVGGSLLFRAQGAPKGDGFGVEVVEIDSMRDPAKNSYGAAVFGGISNKALNESVALVLDVPDDVIKQLVAKFGPGTEAAKSALAAKLIARKAGLAKKYPAADLIANPPKPDPRKLPVDSSKLPKKLDFLNWKGPGQGLSGTAQVNQVNQEAVDQIYSAAIKGDFVALKKLKFKDVNKSTGAITEGASFGDHKSQHVKDFYSLVLDYMEVVSNPAAKKAKSWSIDDYSSIDEVSDGFAAHLYGVAAKDVPANQMLGFWISLGQADAASSFMPEKVAYSSAADRQKGKASVAGLTPILKKWMAAVKGSGSANQPYRDGKEIDNSGLKTRDVLTDAYAHAVEFEEGTRITKGISFPAPMLAQMLALKEGHVFQNPGSMCCSIKENWTGWTGNGRLKIIYAKGAKALYNIGVGSYDSEAEVTTIPGQRFMLMGKENHGSFTEFTVLMLPPDSNYVANIKKKA